MSNASSQNEHYSNNKGGASCENEGATNSTSTADATRQVYACDRKGATEANGAATTSAITTTR